MAQKINKINLDYIKQWEGKRLTAYQDIAGIWTIGYGHTSQAGGPIPCEGMKITNKQAEDILKQDIIQYEQAVKHSVHVELNDNQFTALVSFAYNVGINAFKTSTLLKKLNQGDYDAVPSELMKWVNAGGKRVQGLVNRRAAEGALWVKGAFVSSNYIQPDQTKIKSSLKVEALAPILGAASGLTGFASGSGPFQWALATIMVIGAVTGTFFFVKRMKSEQA